MRRFIVILLLLFASVWIGLKIAADPGYALFAYRYWSVEMPLWFAALAFVLLILVLYALLRFFDSIDISFYRFKNWLRWRRKNKSYSKTNRGLIELIEANWRASEYYLMEGVAQSDAPLVNYLAAAKAAHEQGAYDRRDNYLRKSHDVAPRAEIAIGLTQATLQLEQDQLEQALATLRHLYVIAPRHKLVLRLLQKLYVRLGDWAALIKLFPNLRKAKILNAEQFNELEQMAYQGLLQTAANNKLQDSQAIHEAWKKIPAKFQKNPAVLYSYASVLLYDQQTADELEQLINQSLKNVWNKKLVEIYGFLLTSDPKKQLAHAEGWLKRYPGQAGLYLLLGRLCMRNQLWGKARSYFEESLKLEASSKVYMEYAQLLEQLGEASHALRVYRDGLSFTLS